MRIPFVLLAASFFSLPAFSGGDLEKKSYSEIGAVIQEVRGNYKAGELLVAFDLDNTLLKTNQDLAGEHWFDWQRSLLPKERMPAHSIAVAKDLPDLLAKQSLLLSVSKMAPTDPAAVDLVRELQGQGITTMIITSRGSGEVGYTQRELRKNGFDFSKTPLPPRIDFAGFYQPLDPAHPREVGLTPAELQKFNLTKPRPVGYFYGVLYVEGQHKGGILRTLLKKTGSSFKAMVYVDNLSKHMAGMREAMTPTEIDLTTIHYTGMQQSLTQFDLSETIPPNRKAAARKGYEDFMQTMGRVFGY